MSAVPSTSAGPEQKTEPAPKPVTGDEPTVRNHQPVQRPEQRPQQRSEQPEQPEQRPAERQSEARPDEVTQKIANPSSPQQPQPQSQAHQPQTQQSLSQGQAQGQTQQLQPQSQQAPGQNPAAAAAQAITATILPSPIPAPNQSNAKQQNQYQQGQYQQNASQATRAYQPYAQNPHSHGAAAGPQGFGQPSFGDEPTVRVAPVSPPGDAQGPMNTGLKNTDLKKKLLSKPGLIAASVVGLLGLLYVFDLLITSGDVPRGVTVAGVDVGGLSRTAAEEKLRGEIEPRMSQPLQVKAGASTESINPTAAGLTLDWPSTLDRAGDQPLNPFTRLVSFFTTEEVGFATKVDQAKLDAAVEELRAKIDRSAEEGTIRFEGIEPVAVEPKPGQKLDIAGAASVVLGKWATGELLELPVSTVQVKVSAESVREMLEQVAKPAVSDDLVVHGEGKDATFEPEDIANALIFEPTPDGKLNARLDQPKVIEALGPQLKSTEKDGKDATIVFDGGAPVVHPSEDGKKVKWDEAALGEVLNALKRTDNREVQAAYELRPAKVTTEQANQLGIKEVIGEFSTGGFASDSGVNIRVVAQKVNGAIVKPGETFSLNGFTGPRGTPQGYVEAGVIKDGAPGREVGGGISQFATTLYNAAYFGGMKDAGHKEHSFYISRYPPAREATVFQDPSGKSLIDLKFTNDSQTGVAIQTIWTPSSITVKLWGTKRYIVESIPGARTNPTDPTPHPGPAENCHASNGSPGFTTSDTRVIKDAATGREIRREPRTVRYNPQPKIICGPPPPA